MHHQQTACRSWSVCRAESSEARDTLQVMCTAILEPLASSAWPPEAWRTRGWPRQDHLNGRRKFVSEIARSKRVKKQDLEGVIIFLSCGGGDYLLDYLLVGLDVYFWKFFGKSDPSFDFHCLEISLEI